MLDLSFSSDIFLISGGECAAFGAPFTGGIFLEDRVLSNSNLGDCGLFQYLRFVAF